VTSTVAVTVLCDAAVLQFGAESVDFFCEFLFGRSSRGSVTSTVAVTVLCDAAVLLFGAESVEFFCEFLVRQIVTRERDVYSSRHSPV